MIFTVLGGLLIFIGAVCAIIILVLAFMDEIWKGIVGLICGFYLLYWALAEMEHEKKWLLVGGWLAGGMAIAAGAVSP